MHRRFPRRLPALFTILGICLLQAGNLASAGTHTWIGTSSDPSLAKWSNPSNWDGGIPSNVADEETAVIFNSGSFSHADLPDVMVDRMIFNGSANTIEGDIVIRPKWPSSLFAAGEENIVDKAGGNFIHAGISASTSAMMTIGVNAGSSTISRVTGLANVGKTGTGTLVLGSLEDRGGVTQVQAGTVLCDPVNEQEIIVGNPYRPAPSTFRLLADTRRQPVPSSLRVTVNAYGTFDLGGHDVLLRDLEINGGSVVNIDSRLEVTGLTLMSGASLSGTGTYFPTGDLKATILGSEGSTISCNVGLEDFRRIYAYGWSPQIMSLTISGVISGNGGFKLEGYGKLLLNGEGDNTYKDMTIVASGALVLDSPAIPIPGNLIVDELVEQRRADQIADHATVEVSGMVFFFADEKINSLVVTYGVVEMENNSVIELEGADSLTLDSGYIGHHHSDGTLVLKGHGTFFSNGRIPSIITDLRLSPGTILHVNDGRHECDLSIGGEIRGDTIETELIKRGHGTLFLNSPNNFTGLMSVEEGKTVFMKDNKKCRVVVARGASIGGHAELDSFTTRMGATVAPGEGPLVTGTLSATRANLAGGSLDILLAPKQKQLSGVLKIRENLNISNSSLVARIGEGHVRGRIYVIATYGTLTGKFAKIPEGFIVDYAYPSGGNNRNIALLQPKPAAIDIKTEGRSLVFGHSGVNFGTVDLGKKQTKSFTITNTGDLPLTNISISAPGKKSGFTLKKPLTTTLGSRKTMTFQIVFTPPSAGPKVSKIQIRSNDMQISQLIIDLRGNGKKVKKKKSANGALAIIGKRNIRNGASAKPGTATEPARWTLGTVTAGGEKFRTITFLDQKERVAPEMLVEVSGDLLEWSSGPNHVKLISSRGGFITVRDTVPMRATTKRHIRLVE